MGVKERLLEFIESKGITVRDFERNCGISNGAVSKMTSNTRESTYNRLSIAYPDLNIEWLKTGVGEMICENLKKDVELTLNYDRRGSPVFDIDATCGAEVRDIYFTSDRIIGYIDLPEVRPNTKIVRANGDSMKPVINDGNFVAIREIHSWDTVFYGQIYLVLMEEYRMLKYLRRYEPDEENYVILRSENPNYDDMRVSKDKIIKLFIVENVLSVKIQL